MNNKYIHGTNQQPQNKNNLINQNPSSNYNLNNQRFSSDFLISPFKEEESTPNNTKKKPNLLNIQNTQDFNKDNEIQILNNKILSKNDLKDSNTLIDNNINKSNNIVNNDITVSNNNMNKLQELLESKKIINTLCSIRRNKITSKFIFRFARSFKKIKSKCS